MTKVALLERRSIEKRRTILVTPVRGCGLRALSTLMFVTSEKCRGQRMMSLAAILKL